MDSLDHQKRYWNKVAQEKTFSHPLQEEKFRSLVPPEAPILDYGCGYGRTCIRLKEMGYSNVVGVDISAEMISRGLDMQPDLDLRRIDPGPLPFPDNHFTACTLMAVLTCMATNQGHRELIAELHRVLTPGGFLYLSDYPIQSGERVTNRYKEYEKEFGTYGVFRLPDGGVLRHHTMDWIYELISGFDKVAEYEIPVLTMNGNDSVIFQIIGRKPE